MLNLLKETIPYPNGKSGSSRKSNNYHRIRLILELVHSWRAPRRPINELWSHPCLCGRDAMPKPKCRGSWAPNEACAASRRPVALPCPTVPKPHMDFAGPQRRSLPERVIMTYRTTKGLKAERGSTRVEATESKKKTAGLFLRCAAEQSG